MNARTVTAWTAAFVAVAVFLGTGYTKADTTQAPAEATRQLTVQNRLLIVRGVGGEFAKVVRSIPSGKKGFELVWGKPIDEERLSDSLRLFGTAAAPGDTVQITAIDFSGREIRVEIDGGGRSHFNWREHLQVNMGEYSTPSPDPSPKRPTGGVLILEFGRTIPNLTPDQLMHALSLFLDFSAHSASVNWIDRLSPAYRDAIQTAQVIVGMDREMVIAAKGIPDQKVRQWDEHGNEMEDWIYGLPPSPSTFVTFSGEKVVRVEQCEMSGK